MVFPRGGSNIGLVEDHGKSEKVESPIHKVQTLMDITKVLSWGGSCLGVDQIMLSRQNVA